MPSGREFHRDRQRAQRGSLINVARRQAVPTALAISWTAVAAQTDSGVADSALVL
jgi:hypothetical protein